MKKKPTVYLDTNVLSILHYTGGEDEALAHRTSTLEWWNEERHHFDLCTSSLVSQELKSGNWWGQEAAIKTAHRLRTLPLTKAAVALSVDLRTARLIPTKERGDAAHLALSIVHGVDYLLTWDQAHLLNQEIRRHLPAFCAVKKVRPPLLVSPDTIPRIALGQEIRRRS